MPEGAYCETDLFWWLGDLITTCAFASRCFYEPASNISQRCKTYRESAARTAAAACSFAMARIRTPTSPLTLAISLCLLMTSSSAATIGLLDDALPTPVRGAAAAVGITPGPSLVDVGRPRLEVRSDSVQSCARQCIANAVTKSTGCQIGDYACECETVNASAIEAGSFACVEAACGALVAQGTFPRAQFPSR